MVAGGPAHACGVIETGDKLLSIDGASVEGKKPSEISHLIVGPPVCPRLLSYFIISFVFGGTVDVLGDGYMSFHAP